jgi:Raf kinase inhibitor-like YbhB/YbcL family protein
VDAPSTGDGPSPDSTPPADGGSSDGLPPGDTSSPDTGSQPDGSTPDVGGDAMSDGSSAFRLTSTAFAEGAMIPSAHTCAGTNVSPPLEWTAGPAGTLSYAIVFTDRSNGLIHSVIYDIPASVTSLPMNVENVANPTAPAGAKQVRGYDNTTYGYLGPCPSGMLHTYEFMVYAVGVAALPGVMTTSTRAQVNTAILANDLLSAPLTGTSDATRPP